MKAPEGFRYERGFLWPANDVRCASYAFDSTADLELVYSYCRSYRVVVQAGGNCGIWPRALGRRFERVYTFEPCPTNFRCLAANAEAENIFKFNAALGEKHELVNLVCNPLNIGAHFIDNKPGRIPTLRIDDLSLDTCDLILLDIEGYETQAIRGARETIEKFKPVIVVEDRGYSQRYGVPQGYIEQELSSEYYVVNRPHFDLILIPKHI